jgi:peptide-methionine (R)-S-oxide reductase
MRLLPTLIRSFYAFSNATFRVAPPALRPALRPTAKLGLPSIPFLGAFFGTSSSSNNMTYPLQKGKEEWQAQLSPGMSCLITGGNATVE